jgi:hypothetical protein
LLSNWPTEYVKKSNQSHVDDNWKEKKSCARFIPLKDWFERSKSSFDFMPRKIQELNFPDILQIWNV